mmetsp:Transcript_35594/g.80319  ORF Transcript_35594/g.80319 Transcript_35594/m.80319 type:complete len:242 (+) Transcript_35594:1053-1778(+)|eukprot:762749-Hanusia_phi.AAC.5
MFVLTVSLLRAKRRLLLARRMRILSRSIGYLRTPRPPVFSLLLLLLGVASRRSASLLPATKAQLLGRQHVLVQPGGRRFHERLAQGRQVGGRGEGARDEAGTEAGPRGDGPDLIHEAISHHGSSESDLVSVPPEALHGIEIGGRALPQSSHSLHHDHVRAPRRRGEDFRLIRRNAHNFGEEGGRGAERNVHIVALQETVHPAQHDVKPGRPQVQSLHPERLRDVRELLNEEQLGVEERVVL